MPGAAAFKLYDTYGFPLDLTQDALREKERTVDVDGFDAAMEEQKAKARAAWAGSGETADAAIWFDLAEKRGATEFLGYDTEIAEGQILSLVIEGSEHAGANVGDKVQIILNQTPFYAESGGQVGDTGILKTDTGAATITDTRKAEGLFVHVAEVTEGSIAQEQGAELVVDHDRRSTIRSNHSATHLLHEALRQALGDHVAQRGSLNAPDRLRFDFSHAKALSTDELARVKTEVNSYIRQNARVETRIMTPDEARDLGAQALFGEKYGDEVRVVSMGAQSGSGKGRDGETYSLELCGGTHVDRTGDIGVFVTLGDSASSAGVRRIEALTGQAAFDYLSAQDQRLADTASKLRAQPADVPSRVQALLDERKALQNEIANLRREIAMGGGSSGEAVQEVNGTKLVMQALSGVSGKELPSLIDAHKDKIGAGVVLLIAENDDKAAVAAGVTDDLSADLSAVDIVKAAIIAMGGKGGGGRPHLAQGGAPAGDTEAAFAAVEDILKG